MEWFRFYESALHKRKIQQLPDDKFKAWVNLLCIANSGDGILPSVTDIAFDLRKSEAETEEILQFFVEQKLIDMLPCGSLEMHEWGEHQKSSDNSSERSKRYRAKQREKRLGNPVTKTETPERNNRDAQRDASRDAQRDCITLEQNRTDTEQNRGEENRSACAQTENPPSSENPYPHPEKTEGMSSQQRNEFSAWAEEIYLQWPKQRNHYQAMYTLKKYFATDHEARKVFLENFPLWRDHHAREPDFAPPLADGKGGGFIEDQGWKRKPPVLMNPKTKGKAGLEYLERAKAGLA